MGGQASGVRSRLGSVYTGFDDSVDVYADATPTGTGAGAGAAAVDSSLPEHSQYTNGAVHPPAQSTPQYGPTSTPQYGPTSPAQHACVGPRGLCS